MKNIFILFVIAGSIFGCAYADGYWVKKDITTEQLQQDWHECKKRTFTSKQCMKEKDYNWEKEGNRKIDFSPFGSIPVGRQK